MVFPLFWDKCVHPISCCSLLPATSWSIVQPPPEPESHVFVSGQQIDGTYLLDGECSDAPTFTLEAGGWTLWWSTEPHGWFITPEVGVLVEAPGSMWYKLADFDPYGLYTAQSPTDAGVTVYGDL